jgi:hypothetical protein
MPALLVVGIFLIFFRLKHAVDGKKAFLYDPQTRKSSQTVARVENTRTGSRPVA